MGTTNRNAKPAKKAKKKAAKKAAKKSAIKKIACPSLDAITESIDGVITEDDPGTALMQVAKHLASLTESDAVSQDALEAYDALKAIETAVKKAVSAAKEQLVRKRDQGLGFEPGEYIISFPETTRVAPLWKNEAIATATLLAEERGEVFVADEYIEEIHSKYEPKTSVNVRVDHAE